MTEPTELMPCPFCGGNARKVKHSAGSPGTTGHDRWHGVACAGCNACVGARDRRFRTSAAAIAAWNTRTPQPTQGQAGSAPLTPIRQAALDLYKPPFRHEHGYIRDANNQIVSDDASSVATGLIAARIRGWGRIQYMDKPEQRAAALQDEVAEIVAEALNAYWAAHGIKGGRHGTE